MMYSAEQAAGYIVEKCIRDGQLISNLQLQKILYYAQRVFLQAGSRLFDDDFEAWPFGPVVPSVYYKYCAYGTMPIDFSDGTYQVNYPRLKSQTCREITQRLPRCNLLG
jgi:uncharacterized phage-associated protein